MHIALSSFTLDTRGPPPRDRTFLGYHAPHAAPAELVDVFGTLEGKAWAADATWLLAELRRARLQGELHVDETQEALRGVAFWCINKERKLAQENALLNAIERGNAGKPGG